MVRLFHLRWKVPILGQLAKNPANGRVAALARQLDVGRTTVVRTLRVLVDDGLVGANPGYGHPLRPEYILTERGRTAAEWSVQFVAAAERRPDLLPLIFRKWSMPVLVLVASGVPHFGELQAELRDITARALTLTLKQLGDAALVVRTVSESYPVRTHYRATARGRALARWAAGCPNR